MKITWFSGTTMRIQIAGRIVVVDPDGAPQGIDRAELVAGADTVLALDARDIPDLDPAGWRPRKSRRLIDEEPGTEGVRLWRLGPGAVLVDALDEAPAILCGPQARPDWGRWAERAVLILCGPAAHCAGLGSAALAAAAPTLLALAVSDGQGEAAFAVLAPRLDGAALLMLEPGLAVEV